MKKKSDLIKELETLKKEKSKSDLKVKKHQEQEWAIKMPFATKICHKELAKIFPNMVKNLKYEHTDLLGYWFSFELINDNRRQNYRVNHSQLEV